MSGGNGTKILVRARKGRIVAGVCAGIADYSGQVQIHPGHLASTWRPTLRWLLASRRWTRLAPTLAIVLP